MRKIEVAVGRQLFTALSNVSCLQAEALAAFALNCLSSEELCKVQHLPLSRGQICPVTTKQGHVSLWDKAQAGFMPIVKYLGSCNASCDECRCYLSLFTWPCEDWGSGNKGEQANGYAACCALSDKIVCLGPRSLCLLASSVKLW